MGSSGQGGVVGYAAGGMYGAAIGYTAGAANQAGKAAQSLHGFNRAVRQIEADQLLQTGEYEAGIQDIKGKILQDKQRAGFAGQGVVVGAGTTQAVIDSTAAMSDADKMMIKLNARRAAFGALVGAENENMQGNLARMQGEQQAVSSVIGGVTQAASMAIGLA